MALIKYSLFYCRFFNHINKRPKVFSGWSKVNQFPLQVRIFHGEANEKVVAKLRKKDGIANDYTIIYRAPYEMYCKVCYGVTVFSTTTFPALFSSILFAQGFGNFPLMLAGIEMAKSNTDILLFAGGLLIMIIQAGSVIFKYPYRIYQNSSSNKYIMVYQHILPWKVQKEELIMGELRKTEKSLMPWHDSLYEFKNKKAILLHDYFRRPVDLELMMKTPAKDTE